MNNDAGTAVEMFEGIVADFGALASKAEAEVGAEAEFVQSFCPSGQEKVPPTNLFLGPPPTIGECNQLQAVVGTQEDLAAFLELLKGDLILHHKTLVRLSDARAAVPFCANLNDVLLRLGWSFLLVLWLSSNLPDHFQVELQRRA